VPPEAREPECTTEATGVFHCKPVVTECSDDADCEQGWICDENPDRPVCGGAEPARGGSGGGDDGMSGGDTPAEDESAPADSDCGSDEPARVCLPPYHDVGGRGVARGDSETGSDSLSDGDEDSAPEEDPRPSAGGDDDGESASEGDAEEDDCAVAAPGSGGGNGGAALGVLALLGLCARLRRRARQSAAAQI
jgi:hypothetical protein